MAMELLFKFEFAVGVFVAFELKNRTFYGSLPTTKENRYFNSLAFNLFIINTQ